MQIQVSDLFDAYGSKAVVAGFIFISLLGLAIAKYVADERRLSKLPVRGMKRAERHEYLKDDSLALFGSPSSATRSVCLEKDLGSTSKS